MALDLSSLEKAVSSLQNAVTVAGARNLAKMPKDQQDVIKAGVIQNFEFTYELCWKFLRRWLAHNLGATYVEGASRKEMFRLGVRNRLIDSMEQWMEYHEARNETSHTYDRNRADAIFAVAKSFLPDAKRFAETLEKKND